MVVKDRIMVSVLCTAYNHEKYIRKCLDGFVKQKTSFCFEVLINDDASTDDTARIIREYELKYPDIIKPIYQLENQMSQGVRVAAEILLPVAKGKYIAICDGDDYWTDCNKLQKQVEALEANSNCKLAVHKVLAVTEDESRIIRTFPDFDLKEGVVSPKEFLNPEYAQYNFQTSSYMFDAQRYKQLFQEAPTFYRISPVGDECWLLYVGCSADVFYLADTMSCYRCGSQGSWNSSVQVNVQKRLDYNKKMLQVFRSFDNYSELQFHDYCLVRTWRFLYNIAILLNRKEDYRALIKGENFHVFLSRDLRAKASVLLGAYALPVLEVYRRIKKWRLLHE